MSLYSHSASDVNECSRGTHNCHSNARCTNTDGSFRCTCRSGYAGSGTSCTGKFVCLSATFNKNSNLNLVF